MDNINQLNTCTRTPKKVNKIEEVKITGKATKYERVLKFKGKVKNVVFSNNFASVKNAFILEAVIKILATATKENTRDNPQKPRREGRI